MKKLIGIIFAILIAVVVYAAPPSPLVNGLTNAANVTITGGNVTGLTNLGADVLTITSKAPVSYTPPAYVATDGNLVTNGSFETPGSPHFANWTENGTVSPETVYTHSGGVAAKLSTSTDLVTAGRVINTFTVTPETKYYFSFWVRGDGFNTSEYYIRDVSNSSAILSYTSTGISEPNYRQVTGSFTTPSGCTSVYFLFRSIQAGATVPIMTAYPPVAWFDDLVVLPTEITPDPTSIVSTFNGGISLGGVSTAPAPTLALGSSGVLTGTYRYMVTFINQNGETSISNISSPISPSSQKVIVTIPVSSDPTVYARNIFREKAGVAGTYYYLATVYDNTTTSYSDNIADSALGYDNHYLSSSLATAGALYANGKRIFKDFGIALAIGQDAAKRMSKWDNNVIVGDYSASSLTNASYTTVVGSQAGRSIVSNPDNTLVGGKAGFFLTGGANTFIGSRAGLGSTTTNAAVGDTNAILIGAYSNRSVASATALTNYIGIGYGTLIDKSNQVKIGNSSITENVLYGSTILRSSVGTGGLKRISRAALSGAMSGASVTITMGVPTNARLLGVQLKVKDVITSDSGTTWGAAFAGGSTTAIASGLAFTANTTSDVFLAAENTTAETNIVLTPNSGVFTAGNVQAVVYTEEFDAL